MQNANVSTIVANATGENAYVLPAALVDQAVRIDLGTSDSLPNATLQLPYDLESIQVVTLLGDDLAVVDGEDTLYLYFDYMTALETGRLESLLLPGNSEISALDILDIDAASDALYETLNSIDTSAGAEADVTFAGSNRRFENGKLSDDDSSDAAPLTLDSGTNIDGNPDRLVRRSFDADRRDRQDLDIESVRARRLENESAAQEPLREVTLDQQSNRADFSDETERLSIDAGNGNDRITGGANADVILGGSGKDRLNGGGGDDRLEGGSGRDRLTGGAGDDTLIGGAGKDRLDGGDGDDILYLGGLKDQNDVIQGGDGFDTVANDGEGLVLRRFDGDNGIEAIEGGNDAVSGTRGSDRLDFSDTALQNVTYIDAGKGRDQVTGSAGNDDIRGGKGRDTLSGGDGNDRLDGGAGKDTLFGGDGDDTLIGGNGKDRLEGGEGGDVFVLGSGLDTIVDFNSAEGDRLDISSVIDTEDSIEDLNAFVQLQEDGRGNTVVKVNAEGSGRDRDFDTVAVLKGVTDVSLDEVIQTQQNLAANG